MTINSVLNSVSAALAQQSSPISVRTSVSSQAVSDVSAPANTAADTSPATGVIQSASLVAASSGLAQLGSFLQIAQTGTQQVGSALEQLVTIANQAASPAEGTDLTGLASEFQQILAQINGTVSKTTFGGTPVLNGSLAASSGSGQSAGSQSAPSSAPAFSLPDLSALGLFGSSALDISTPQNAVAAITALSDAQVKVNAADANISDVQAQLSFATASVGTALANTQAASSTLTESDLGSGAPSDITSELLNNPGASALIQGGNLPGSLLSLVQE